MFQPNHYYHLAYFMSVHYITYYTELGAHKVSSKVKWSHYRPGVSQRVGRGIALLFHDRGTRRGWVVSSTPRANFTPGKDPVLILQEAGWAPGPVWKGGKSRPHWDPIPDRPARSSVAIPTELPDPHTRFLPPNKQTRYRSPSIGRLSLHYCNRRSSNMRLKEAL